MPKKQWVAKTDKVYRTADVRKRFYSKVKVVESGCMEWQASTRTVARGFRYGQFSYNGYPEFAHRVSWMLEHGEIPDGMRVCHSCDNTICVNPAHLFLGTQLDNVVDMVNKERDAFIGERNHSSKLTNETVRLARKWFQEGRTYSEIAMTLGVARRTAFDAIQFRTWKHVEGE